MNPNLENYFKTYKQNIVGNDFYLNTPAGRKKMIYADWVASGRLYRPIEKIMLEKFAPMIGNTHSEASETGVFMTRAYLNAKKIIKKHVNASKDDVIITSGAGMTRVLNKFQRILGLKLPDKNSYFNIKTNRKISDYNNLGNDRPVVFVTHIEHHSNHFSWVETIADVVIIPPCEDLKVCIKNLKEQLKKYKDRKIKIGAFSGGSNVSGCIPPVHEFAKIMHKHNGLCFIDYAASAPYIDINMHPENDKDAYLDAIYFSPHKFLGGPGSAAVLVFNKKLYNNSVPDNPGGGTVMWTNPWNQAKYIDDIEIREDGGTPAFLQTIRTALTVRLKEKMTTQKIMAREKQLLDIAFAEFSKINGIYILAQKIKERIGLITFYSENVHHNLIVKLLNDEFGIQTRGGCSCAGTYGHYLLHIDKKLSKLFTKKVENGDSTLKPGWVRISLHPTMSNDELFFIIKALKKIINNIKIYQKDYYQDPQSGEWFHKKNKFDNKIINDSFKIPNN